MNNYSTSRLRANSLFREIYLCIYHSFLTFSNFYYLSRCSIFHSNHFSFFFRCSTNDRLTLFFSIHFYFNEKAFRSTSQMQYPLYLLIPTLDDTENTKKKNILLNIFILYYIFNKNIILFYFFQVKNNMPCENFLQKRFLVKTVQF